MFPPRDLVASARRSGFRRVLAVLERIGGEEMLHQTDREREFSSVGVRNYPEGPSTRHDAQAPMMPITQVSLDRPSVDFLPGLTGAR